MILTFALTVIFDLTVAVYTGVMLASLLFMRRMSELTGIHTCVSGEEEEAAAHDIPLPDEESVPDGVEIFAINGPLFFGWPTGSSPRWTRWRRLPRYSSCTCTTRPPST